MSVGVVDKTTGDRIPTAGNPLDKVGNLANLTTSAKDNAVNAINEVNAGLATKADLTDLAPAFSTSTAYTVGQYVSYDGNIYKCTSAHSAGAWVAGDFTLVAVGSELSEINSNLSSLAVKNFTSSTRIFEFEENENSRQITIATSGIYRFVLNSVSSNECTVRVGSNQYSMLYAYDGVAYNAVLPIMAGTTLLLTRTGTSSIGIDFLS